MARLRSPVMATGILGEGREERDRAGSSAKVHRGESSAGVGGEDVGGDPRGRPKRGLRIEDVGATRGVARAKDRPRLGRVKLKPWPPRPSTSQREFRLTTFSHGAGCACKLGLVDLAQVLKNVPGANDPRVLVDAATRDDAAVYQIAPDRALIATVDFFTPIVDDAATWGAIAATNALSDVYAMGGVPLFGLNLVGWPRGKIPFELLGEVITGAGTVAARAGCLVLGGHSVDALEPHFGMAVIGEAHPDRLLTNAGAQPGDVLVLTKPLGTGVLTTALKRDVISESDLAEAVREHDCPQRRRDASGPCCRGSRRDRRDRLRAAGTSGSCGARERRGCPDWLRAVAAAGPGLRTRQPGCRTRRHRAQSRGGDLGQLRR